MKTLPSRGRILSPSGRTDAPPLPEQPAAVDAGGAGDTGDGALGAARAVAVRGVVQRALAAAMASGLAGGGAFVAASAAGLGQEIAAGLAAIAAIAAAAIAWKMSGVRRVAVHDNGFVDVRLGGRRELSLDRVEAVCAWSQAVSINGIPAGTVHAVEVRGDGVKVGGAGHGRAWEGVLRATLEVTAAVLLKRATAAIAAGTDAVFGPLRVNHERITGPGGLLQRQREIRLGEIANYTVAAGVFRVWPRGSTLARIAVPVKRVANLHVLVPLLDHMTGRTPPPGEWEGPDSFD
jgi:hypothetical protein